MCVEVCVCCGKKGASLDQSIVRLHLSYLYMNHAKGDSIPKMSPYDALVAQQDDKRAQQEYNRRRILLKYTAFSGTAATRAVLSMAVRVLDLFFSLTALFLLLTTSR